MRDRDIFRGFILGKPEYVTIKFSFLPFLPVKKVGATLNCLQVDI